MDRERRRLAVGLLLSLLVHSLLLTLTFEGQGLGLPGFGFPWQERRIEAPELRVVLAPGPGAGTESAIPPVAEPAQQAWVAPPAAVEPAPAPPVSAAPPPGVTAATIVPPARTAAEANPVPSTVVRAAPATTAPPVERPDRAAATNLTALAGGMVHLLCGAGASQSASMPGGAAAGACAVGHRCKSGRSRDAACFS